MKSLRTFIPLLVSILLGAVPLSAAAARWVPVGPEGGAVQVIAPSPSSAERLYAAFQWGPYGFDTLVMRSDDGGASWHEANGGLEGERIIALAVDPQDPDRAFAVAAIQGCFSDDPGGVYRTEDAGAHWQRVATSDDVGGLACGTGLLVLPDAVLVGTGYGVARSTDGGTTWQAIPLTPTPGDVHTLQRDPVDEDVLYAAGWQARFKSTDGGGTWSLIEDPARPSGVWVTGLAVAPSDPETLYEYGINHTLWRSRNGGASWEETGAAPETDNLYGVPLLIDPHDPDTLFLGTESGFWVSRDGGATFAPLRQGLPALGPDSTAFYGLPDLEADAEGRILLGTPKGLFVSTDAGRHWTAEPLHGVHGNAIGFLRFDPFEPRRLLFTSFDTLFETRDGGTTFAPLPSPPGILQAIEFDPFRRGRLLALTVLQDGEQRLALRLLTSLDGGHHWGAPSPTPFSGSFAAAALAVPAPNVVVVTSENRIYRREGASVAWRKVLQAKPTDEDRGWFTFEGMVRDPYRKDTLFAYGLDHFLHAGVIANLYRSLDAGRTWSRWQENATLSSLAFDLSRPDSVYLTHGADIYRHSIEGSGSRRIGRITPPAFPAVLLVDRSDPKTFFAATAAYDVLVSGDGAKHWSLLAPGLPLSGVAPVTVLEQDRVNPLRLYAVPVTGGLWRVDRER
jgi:photosystem II stability/assembly factor-like uncharacterized protein